METTDEHESVHELHDRMLKAAAEIVRHEEHDPMVLIVEESGDQHLISLAPVFTDDEGKDKSVFAVRTICEKIGADRVLMISEAYETAYKPDGKMVEGSRHEVLAITIEDPGVIHSWFHPINVLESGARTVAEDGRYIAGDITADHYTRFLFLKTNILRDLV